MKKSHIFWFVVTVLIWVALYFLNMELFYILQVVGSITLFVTLSSGTGYLRKYVLVSLTFIPFIVVVFILGGVYSIGKHIRDKIIQFNNWLNNE